MQIYVKISESATMRMRARMVCAILVIYSERKFREMDYDGATDEYMMEAYTYNSENHY
jgi:hypothetical protein